MRHNPLPLKYAACFLLLPSCFACSFVNRQVYLLSDSISTPDASALTIVESNGRRASFANKIISVDIGSLELYTRICDGPPYLPIIPSFADYGNQQVIDVSFLKDRPWTHITLKPEMFQLVAGGRTYKPDLYASRIDIGVQRPANMLQLKPMDSHSRSETVRLKYQSDAMASEDAHLNVSQLIVDGSTISFTVKLRREVRWRFEPYHIGNW